MCWWSNPTCGGSWRRWNFRSRPVLWIFRQPDVCLAALIERHGRTGSRSLVLVKGLGLRRGAAASTVAHDCHNLIVVGRTAGDMLPAAQELERCGGGFCTALDGKITAFVPLPVAGLMSPEPAEVLAAQLDHLNRALKDLGWIYAAADRAAIAGAAGHSCLWNDRPGAGGCGETELMSVYITGRFERWPIMIGC